jgi:hypothetical protein
MKQDVVIEGVVRRRSRWPESTNSEGAARVHEWSR